MDPITCVVLGVLGLILAVAVAYVLYTLAEAIVHIVRARQ